MNHKIISLFALLNVTIIILFHLQFCVLAGSLSPEVNSTSTTTAISTTTNRVNQRKTPQFRKLKISSFTRHNVSQLSPSPTNSTLPLPTTTGDKSRQVTSIPKWNSSRLFNRRKTLLHLDHDLDTLENNLEFSKFALPYHDKKPTQNNNNNNGKNEKSDTQQHSTGAKPAKDNPDKTPDSQVTLIPFQVPVSALQDSFAKKSSQLKESDVDHHSNEESSWNPITYINPVDAKMPSERHSRRPPMIDLSGTSLSQLYALPPLTSALPMSHFHESGIYQPLSSLSTPYSHGAALAHSGHQGPSVTITTPSAAAASTTSHQSSELRRQSYAPVSYLDYPELPPHHQSQPNYQEERMLTTPVYHHQSNQHSSLAHTEDYIPGTMGKPWKDYPMFSQLPVTNFHCPSYGFYADVEAGCQMWHYCQPDGRHDAFLCANGTLFNQATRVCDWWYNVDCRSSTQKYSINQDLYRVPSSAPHQYTTAHQPYSRLLHSTPMPNHHQSRQYSAATVNHPSLLADDPVLLQAEYSPTTTSATAPTKLAPPPPQLAHSNDGATGTHNLRQSNKQNQYSASVDYRDQPTERRLPSLITNKNYVQNYQNYDSNDYDGSDINNLALFKLVDIQRKKKK